jgi:hypothetical protein
MPSVHQVQLACKVVREHFGSLTEVRPRTAVLKAPLVDQVLAHVRTFSGISRALLVYSLQGGAASAASVAASTCQMNSC